MANWYVGSTVRDTFWRRTFFRIGRSFQRPFPTVSSIVSSGKVKIGDSILICDGHQEVASGSFPVLINPVLTNRDAWIEVEYPARRMI